MPIPATRTTLSRIGPETTPGTPVAVTRQLQSMSFMPNIQTKTLNFQPAGYKYGSSLAMIQEWTEVKVDGEGDVAAMIYPLAGLFGAVTPSTPATGVLTRDWVWNPSTTAVENAKTYTIENGSSVRTGQIANGTFVEFGLAYDREAIVKATGKMIGQRYLDGFTPTAAPNEQQTIAVTGAPTGGTIPLTFLGQTASVAFSGTSAQVVTALTGLTNIGAANVTATGGPLPATPVAVTFVGPFAGQRVPTLVASSASLTGGTTPAVTVTETTVGGFEVLAQPMSGSQVTLYADTSAANFGTTALVAPLAANWKLTNKFVPIWVLNATNTSWAQVLEGDPKIEIDFTLPADATGMGYLTNARAGSTIFLRFRTVGGLIEGSLNYETRFDFAVKIKDVGELKDHKGVWAVNYKGECFHDYTWGQAAAMLVRGVATSL